MKIRSEKDSWSGPMFIAVGVGFAWGATRPQLRQFRPARPRLFPFGLGILLAVLGAIILFKALTFEVEGGDKIGPWPLKQAALILGAVVVFGLMIPHVGPALALPALIGIGSLASGEFHLKEVLINCVVLTVASWAIFIKGLGLIIPLWPDFLG